MRCGRDFMNEAVKKIAVVQTSASAGPPFGTGPGPVPNGGPALALVCTTAIFLTASFMKSLPHRMHSTATLIADLFTVKRYVHYDITTERDGKCRTPWQNASCRLCSWLACRSAS